jgi:hypothetical protein
MTSHCITTSPLAQADKLSLQSLSTIAVAKVPDALARP